MKNGDLLRTLSARFGLACLLLHAGGAWANVSSSGAETTARADATLLSVGDVPDAALPRRDSALAVPRARAESRLARYVPPTLDSRVVFAANGAGVTQEKGASPAAATKPAPALPLRQRVEKEKPPAARANGPLVTVKTTAPGQAGYVHFFLLDMPDGDTETQIGIELPDGRIAWSFPETGVSVAPFLQSGQIEVNGRVYPIQHLYGMRPFHDDEAMFALRRDLWDRVIPWVEAETPYCNSVVRSQQMCLSCLGFALQVLFPGRTPAYPGLPSDFPRTASSLYYTTDDLVLYLTGLHALPSLDARLARLKELSLPENLRAELVTLVQWIDEKGIDTAATPTARTLSEKMRSGVRSYSRTPPQRKRL